jgi:D-tyrosyl-tRNA(Tyr) deacylase
MRAVVQRVKKSSVSVDGEIKGSVGKGYNVLLGVMQGDTKAQAELLAAKITKLRVFEDEAGKMNKSVQILSV